MYPIEDGLFNNNIANDPNSITENESSIDIQQNIKNFTYILSFEDGINLESEPICEICKPRLHIANNISVPDKKEYNLLYNKYIFNINKPILGSKIKVYWKFRNKED